MGIGTYIDADSNYVGVEKTIHEVEIFLGVLIGAVTFTGSVVAFGKLQGVLHSRPLMLPARHVMNILIGLACVWLGWSFVGADPTGGGMLILLIATFLALVFGVHMVMAIGGADMPVVISMLNSCSGWAAAALSLIHI